MTTERFNPVLGFLSASTLSRLLPTLQPCLFQSRSGFSECFDSLHPDGNEAGLDVSIPFWVF